MATEPPKAESLEDGGSSCRKRAPGRQKKRDTGRRLSAASAGSSEAAVASGGYAENTEETWGKMPTSALNTDNSLLPTSLPPSGIAESLLGQAWSSVALPSGVDWYAVVSDSCPGRDEVSAHMTAGPAQSSIAARLPGHGWFLMLLNRTLTAGRHGLLWAAAPV